MHSSIQDKCPLFLNNAKKISKGTLKMVKLKLFNKRNATHLRRRNFQVAEEIKKKQKKNPLKGKTRTWTCPDLTDYNDWLVSAWLFQTPELQSVMQFNVCTVLNDKSNIQSISILNDACGSQKIKKTSIKKKTFLQFKYRPSGVLMHCYLCFFYSLYHRKPPTSISNRTFYFAFVCSSKHD